MSLRRVLWRSTAFVSLANVIARVGTFLANLVVIRLLGVNLVGQLGLIESWLGLVLVFSVFGLDLAATRYIAHHREKDAAQVGRIATTAFLLGALFSLGVGLALYLILARTPPEGSGAGVYALVGVTRDVLTDYAAVFLCLVVSLSLRQLAVGVIYGLQTFQTLVVANTVVGLLSLPISYLLVRWRGLAGALDAHLVLTIVETALLAGAIWRVLHRIHAPVSLRGFRLNARRLVGFGLPTFVGQLVANPVQPLATSFLASQPGGLVQVGLLTTARRLPSLANFLPASMASTVTPALSAEWGRDDPQHFADSILVALRMLWLLTLPIVVFFLAASPTLLGWLYGSEYTAAWVVAFIFLVGTLLAGINETSDRAFAAANRMWLSTANNLFWTVSFFLLAIQFIPRWLAVGFALTFLISYSLYVALQLGWLKRLFGLSLRPLAALLLFSVLLIAVAWLIAANMAALGQVAAAALLTAVAVALQWRVFLNAGEKRAVVLSLQRLRGAPAAFVGRLRDPGWRSRPGGNGKEQV
jgi:O-antigen/teichoic acid export membrane protein